MSRFQLFSSLLLLTFSTSLFAQQAQTTETTTTSTTQSPSGPVTVQKRVITTTVPAAKEIVTTPAGYASCTSVPAAWENDIWIPEHRVCKYDNSPLGAAWVEGYWSCTQYQLESGTCTNWNWVAAHWVKTYSEY